jgi:hypothetical protein
MRMLLTPVAEQVEPLRRTCPYCGEVRPCRTIRFHVERCPKAPVGNLVELRRLASNQSRRVCPYCHTERPVSVFNLHVAHCLKNPRRAKP